MRLILFLWAWVVILFSLSLPALAQDQKLARARDEKKVVVYNTTTVPDMQKIIEGFHKKYPFLEVESFRSNGERLLQKIFTEVIVAPVFEPEALELLKQKPNLRVIEQVNGDALRRQILFRSVMGGMLVQQPDNRVLQEAELKPVTQKKPTDQQTKDLLFAFTVCKHVKSNAIVYVKNGATVGIGAGQMSRIDSARIAALKAADAAAAMGAQEPLARGSVVASDAFFPFPDGLLAAADAGATAVIQPGGAMRDADVIAAADEKGLAMVFTGMRHFRH